MRKKVDKISTKLDLALKITEIQFSVNNFLQKNRDIQFSVWLSTSSESEN